MKEDTFKQFTNILEDLGAALKITSQINARLMSCYMDMRNTIEEARAQNRLLTEANYEMQKQLKEIRKDKE